MTEPREPRDPQARPGEPADPADELLGAYALDALDANEAAQVEQRLAASPAAQAELDRLTHAMDQVIESQADAPQPPADLWDRIAGQLPPRPERLRAAGDPAPTAAAPLTPLTVLSPEPVDQPADQPEDELAARRVGRRSRTAGILLAVAAAVVIVALGVGLVRRSDTSASNVAAQLERQADRAATQPGSHTATLTGSDPAVSVRVVIDDQGRGYVVPDGLPALGSDQTYQLWSVDGGTPISLGLLGSDPTVAVVGTGTSPSQLAITAEPAGGSTGPTSNPVAVGTLA